MGILSILPMFDGTRLFFPISFQQNKNYAIESNGLKYVRSKILNIFF